MSSRGINDLCHDLQVLCHEWKMQCNSQGLSVAVIQTWRSPDEQNIAKASGLSKASAGESPHNCCKPDGTPNAKAFDFGVFDNGQYIKDGTDPRYRQAGEIGKELGLVWGGDFHSIYDPDHLEMNNWKTI